MLEHSYVCQPFLSHIAEVRAHHDAIASQLPALHSSQGIPAEGEGDGFGDEPGDGVGLAPGAGFGVAPGVGTGLTTGDGAGLGFGSGSVLWVQLCVL